MGILFTSLYVRVCGWVSVMIFQEKSILYPFSGLLCVNLLDFLCGFYLVRFSMVGWTLGTSFEVEALRITVLFRAFLWSLTWVLLWDLMNKQSC